MVKQGKSTAAEAPDMGAFDVADLDPATRTLLEQAGELVIGGRLHVYAPPVTDAEAPDEQKESGDVG